MRIAGNLCGIPVRRLLPLFCLLLILAGSFAGHYRELNANSPDDAPATAAATVASRLQLQAVEAQAASADKLASQPSIWPAAGVVSAGFGWRQSPWGDGRELHQGIDIAVEAGTPVVAAADGQVAQSGWGDGYGNVVQLNHGNGIVTVYGHNSSLLVPAGQAVKKGQVIALAGSSGRSTGPHVHYEVRINGTAVDPLRFLALE